MKTHLLKVWMILGVSIYHASSSSSSSPLAICCAMNSSMASCKGCWWCAGRMQLTYELRYIFCSWHEPSLTWTEKSIELRNQLNWDMNWIEKSIAKWPANQESTSRGVYGIGRPQCTAVSPQVVWCCMHFVLECVTLNWMKKIWDTTQTITLIQPCFPGNLTSASLPFGKPTRWLDAPTLPVEMLLSGCHTVHLIELLQLISQWLDFWQIHLPRRQAPNMFLDVTTCCNMLYPMRLVEQIQEIHFLEMNRHYTFFEGPDVWIKHVWNSIDIFSWLLCSVELLLGQLEHRKNCRHVLAAGLNSWTKSCTINMEDRAELPKMWPDISISIPQGCEFIQHHPRFSRHFALKKNSLSPKALDATPGVELVQCACKCCNFLKLRNHSPSQWEKNWGPDWFTGSRRRGHKPRIYWCRIYIVCLQNCPGSCILISSIVWISEMFHFSISTVIILSYLIISYHILSYLIISYHILSYEAPLWAWNGVNREGQLLGRTWKGWFQGFGQFPGFYLFLK